MSSDRVALVHEAERLFAGAAAAAASQLAQRASDERLSTIKESHLQKEFRAALERLAHTTRPQPKVSPTLSHNLKREWPRLGLFDISLGWGDKIVFGELKCGEEDLTLSACGWDAAKEAFCLQHGVGTAMFLVAAAPARRWSRPGIGIELLSDGVWDMADLRNRYAAGFRKWEGGGYKPDYVFRRLRTIAVSCTEPVAIADREWVIGVSRVEAVDDERMEWVPFLGPRPAREA
jgi:hypothetical protein